LWFHFKLKLILLEFFHIFVISSVNNRTEWRKVSTWNKISPQMIRGRAILKVSTINLLVYHGVTSRSSRWIIFKQLAFDLSTPLSNSSLSNLLICVLFTFSDIWFIFILNLSYILNYNFYINELKLCTSSKFSVN
jgi:hypothetical protein